MKIKHAVSNKEKNELDQLLWDVLWKPLGLPRGIRKSFKLNNPQIDLIAVDNGTVIGGLVANWLSESENEIFFTKLGFISTGEYREHQDFAKYGIKFQEMYLEVQSNDFGTSQTRKMLYAVRKYASYLYTLIC